MFSQFNKITRYYKIVSSNPRLTTTHTVNSRNKLHISTRCFKFILQNSTVGQPKSLLVSSVLLIFLTLPGVPPPGAVPCQRRGGSVPGVSRAQAGVSGTVRSRVGTSKRGGGSLSPSSPSPPAPLLSPPGLRPGLPPLSPFLRRVGLPGSSHLLVESPELLGQGTVHVEPPVTHEVLLVEESSCRDQHH